MGFDEGAIMRKQNAKKNALFLANEDGKASPKKFILPLNKDLPPMTPKSKNHRPEIMLPTSKVFDDNIGYSSITREILLNTPSHSLLLENTKTPRGFYSDDVLDFSKFSSSQRKNSNHL